MLRVLFIRRKCINHDKFVLRRLSRVPKVNDYHIVLMNTVNSGHLMDIRSRLIADGFVPIQMSVQNNVAASEKQTMVNHPTSK